MDSKKSLFCEQPHLDDVGKWLTTLDDYSDEDIFDVRLKTFAEIIYPPQAIFSEYYHIYQKHQATSWTINEVNVANDGESFKKLPKNEQKLLLAFVSILMFGDTFICHKINGLPMHKIVSPELKAIFNDIEARENVHQIVYSQFLQCDSDNAAFYRSSLFYKKIMSRFDDLFAEINDVIDPATKLPFPFETRVQLFILMICENLLFAPAFHAIIYYSTTGNIPRMSEKNNQVMRDEYIHYENARLILSNFRQKLDKHIARKLFESFKIRILSMIDTVFDFAEKNDFDPEINLLLNSEPNRPSVEPIEYQNFSRSISKNHTLFVMHTFAKENDLYFEDEDITELEEKYGQSPSSVLLELSQKESKSNHMEMNPTIYLPEGSIDHEKLISKFSQIHINNRETLNNLIIDDNFDFIKQSMQVVDGNSTDNSKTMDQEYIFDDQLNADTESETSSNYSYGYYEKMDATNDDMGNENNDTVDDIGNCDIESDTDDYDDDLLYIDFQDDEPNLNLNSESIHINDSMETTTEVSKSIIKNTDTISNDDETTEKKLIYNVDEDLEKNKSNNNLNNLLQNDEKKYVQNPINSSTFEVVMADLNKTLSDEISSGNTGSRTDHVTTTTEIQNIELPNIKTTAKLTHEFTENSASKPLSIINKIDEFIGENKKESSSIPIDISKENDNKPLVEPTSIIATTKKPDVSSADVDPAVVVVEKQSQQQQQQQLSSSNVILKNSSKKLLKSFTSLKSVKN